MMSSTPAHLVMLTGSWKTSMAATMPKESAKGKVPVRQQCAPEVPAPAEWLHPLESKLQQDLTARKKQALYDG